MPEIALRRRHPVACRWIGIIAIQFLTASCATICVAAPAKLAEELRSAAAAQGKIALGEIAAFKNTYLADVTIQTPRVGDDGSVSGTATLAGRDAPVLIQYVEPSSGGVGKWLLAWRLPTQSLGQLIPAIGRVAGQGVEMATPVVIFSRDRLRVPSGSMAPLVREFYQDAYGSSDFVLSVQDGVNLVTSVEVRAEILAGLTTLGLNVDNLVLEGVVLKRFDQEKYRQARQQGRLIGAAVKDAELRAKLASGTLSGLPQAFEIKDLALLITGKPTAGVGFEMLVGTGRDRRRFDCRGLFLGKGAGGGKTGISISARTADKGPWRNAFGIQGLQLNSAALELHSEKGRTGPARMVVGVNGDLKLAGKLVTVAGGITTRKGPPAVFLRGSINSLTRDDLVAVANDLARSAHGGIGQKVVGTVLPDFELRQVNILYAPAGGSAELGVPSGVGLKGQLYLFGSRAAEVDGLVDTSSRKPRTSLKAAVAEFKLGPVTLHDTKLDLLMAASTESHLRAGGGCDLLGGRVAARADLNAQRSEVKMTGRVANAFEADVSCTSSLAEPAWRFSAEFKNDFANSFQSKVSEDILAWAKQAERDFAKVSADLEKAQRDVKRIDADIARARAKVQSDRETNEAALRRAQSDLSRINAEITKMRNQVRHERAVHLNGIRKAKQDVERITVQINARRAAVKAQREKDLAPAKAARDRAKRAYDKAEAAYRKAVAAWKKAKGLKKIAKGIDKDAKGVDRDAKKVVYHAKRKAYDAARAVINKVPVDADPQIVALFAAQKSAQVALNAANAALRKIHGTAPIDADPRVAGLFVGRDTARAAVRVAQEAFEVAHRTPVDADPRVATLFAARDSALAALKAAQVTVRTSGDAVQWGAKATAAATSGQLLRVERARLSGGLSAFEQGGEMSLMVAVRLMNEPRTLNLAVNTADLTNGNLFKMAGRKLVPGKKSTKTNATSLAKSPSRTDTRSYSIGPEPANSAHPPARQRTAPAQTVYAGSPQRWLTEVRTLKRELNAMKNGAGWVKYLQLSDLEAIAAAPPTRRSQHGSSGLEGILAKFEKTATNSDYAAISRKRSFARLLRSLRNESAQERQP